MEPLQILSKYSENNTLSERKPVFALPLLDSPIQSIGLHTSICNSLFSNSSESWCTPQSPMSKMGRRWSLELWVFATLSTMCQLVMVSCLGNVIAFLALKMTLAALIPLHREMEFRSLGNESSPFCRTEWFHVHIKIAFSVFHLSVAVRRSGRKVALGRKLQILQFFYFFNPILKRTYLTASFRRFGVLAKATFLLSKPKMLIYLFQYTVSVY